MALVGVEQPASCPTAVPLRRGLQCPLDRACYSASNQSEFSSEGKMCAATGDKLQVLLQPAHSVVTILIEMCWLK